MIIKQELINKIKDYFDLNIYETKVWLALLSKGIASAGEVADISGVPRSRTYDVLESLEKRGFAIVKLGKPVKYLGVKPKMIIEKMKNNTRKDAEEKIANLSKIKDTDEFLKLENLYKEGIDPVKREDISASIKGKSNISNYLKEIIQEAKKEVIICTNIEEIILRAKLFHQTFELLKKANVKIKVALSGDEKKIKELEDKFDVKFKKVSIEAKFFIIDRKEILFYLSKDKEDEDTAIWLNSEFFAEAFASLFDKAMK
ncbi:MAG: helix-turn-helix domain-containing protein [Candidatus Pacearchaeota archaeon]